jgi:hypothetical protein
MTPRSFFLAGFEGTTGYNRHGDWIDLISATQHDRFLDDDYRRLHEVGILAARETVRWPLVARGGGYDFTTLGAILAASRRHGIESSFDLFHFGYPDDVDLFAPDFPRRFADYCHAVARFVVANADRPYAFTPVNEPSYFSWAAGEAALFAPHCRGRGPELKLQLARAGIAGVNAIRDVDRDATIVSVDALCRVVCPHDRPELRDAVRRFNEEVVFESWDMLAGRLHPELGGSPAHLGTVGVNYYWTNQWELTREGIPLADDDPRRLPLRHLVRAVHERYGAELLITETSHVDDMRPIWLSELAEEAECLLADGVPLRGACLYPILGMPEWHAPAQWTRMGLWDLVPQSPTLARVPFAPMLLALRRAQQLIAKRLSR